MKTSDKSIFKKILENNKRILIFGHYTQCRRIACLGLIKAYEDVNQPIIIVSRDDYLLKKSVSQTNRFSYRNMQYSLIKEESWKDRPDLILTFDCTERGLHLDLEIAIMANRALIQKGYKPFIIIDDFSDIYHSNIDDNLKTFFDEVIKINISKDQHIVIASNSLYNPTNINSILDVANTVISSADCMIALPRILKNNEYVGGGNTVQEINDILDRVKIKESGTRLKSTINEIIEKELQEINETLLFDFNNGLISAI